MGKPVSILAIAAFFGLASCGDTPLEQGLMGGGAGAATAYVLGGSLGTGLVAGAGVNIFCQNYSNRC